MKYLLVKNINELIDKPLHSPCIIYETDNEKVRYEDYGNTMFYFNELEGKLVATPYKITLKKDTFEDSDIIDILDILEVEGPTTNLRFKINDSRFLLKNNTIIPRVAHVETDLELTVYTKYTEETFVLHIVCEDILQVTREFKNATYPDTIAGYLNKITVTYTEVVTMTTPLGTKKIESEETYNHYFVPNVNTDHTTEDFGTNEDTIESKTREVYLKFNEEDYYLGTVTQKSKNHKETWCYHTDNTVKVFNLAQSLYDGVSWNNMDMANTYRLIVGSTVTKFFGLMVSGSPLNTIIFEDTINDSTVLANTTAGLENLKKVVCKGSTYGNSSSASNPRINVEEIYLLGNDTTLKAGFFSSCNAVKKLVLPKTLTAIPDGLCNNAINLSNITLYDNITSIGMGSFSGCRLLEDIKIPNSVIGIGQNAFGGCSGLKSIDIPNSVVGISSGTFGGCTKLTNVTIGNSVTSIERAAFGGCSGLTSVAIPNSITSIGESAFEGCLSLTDIRFEDGRNDISLSRTAFSQCPIETLYLGRNLTSNSYSFANIPTLAIITIGNSVKIITSTAFSNCGIQELEFPDSVETIEYLVAVNCPNLKKLKLSANLKSMTAGLCANCPNLDTINNEYLRATLPDSLTNINPENVLLPFIGTKIKTLVIPKNITSLILGGSLDAAKNLETCILHCKEAIEQGNIYIFLLFGMGIKKVFIPEECSYFSVSCMPYSGLPPGISLNTEEPDILKLPDAYTGEFGLGTYKTNLKEVILSDNVTSLGKYSAFGLSDNLETVDLKNVHTINYNILYYRTKLDYINLPKTVKSIDTDLFEVLANSTGSWGFLEIDWDIVNFLFPSTNYYFWVSHLLKLNIGKNTTLLSTHLHNMWGGVHHYPCSLNISDEGSYIDITSDAFRSLTIKSLHIPERVHSIAPESFNSKYLESVTVDSNNSYYTDCDGSNVLVDKIDNSLLLGCAASTIPEGVVKIHTNAFRECLKLYELEIPETVTTLDRYAINTCKNLGLLKIKNRSTLNIGNYAVDTTMPTQVILDVTSVPTISTVSLRLGNDHKIYIPKNLESAFKADTNWAKLNLVPLESFDTFTVKVTVNVEVLGTPIIANIGEVLPLSIKVDGKSTSLVGDLQYYNTLGEHTLELTYLSALHLGMASESIVRDYTSDAGANTIVNIEYLDTNSIEEKTTKSQLLDTTTKNSTHTLNTDPYSEYGVVTVYYDILNITSATRLFSSHYNNVCAITVDGEPVSPTRALYWFTTPGIHTVKYYFYNKYHCFEYGICPMFVGIEGISKIEIGESFNFMYKLLLLDATIGSLQVNSSNPPVITGNGSISLNCPIYVPAESVEMYKISSYGWSTYADNIQAIS